MVTNVYGMIAFLTERNPNIVNLGKITSIAIIITLIAKSLYLHLRCSSTFALCFQVVPLSE